MLPPDDAYQAQAQRARAVTGWAVLIWLNALALAQLPLEDIATGPADGMGLGEEWCHHSALDFSVPDLMHFPGKGWPLIAASLQSPVVRNRNMAAKALEGWQKSDWPSEALPLVSQAIGDEPDNDLKSRLQG